MKPAIDILWVGERGEGGRRTFAKTGRGGGRRLEDPPRGRGGKEETSAIFSKTSARESVVE